MSLISAGLPSHKQLQSHTAYSYFIHFSSLSLSLTHSRLVEEGERGEGGEKVDIDAPMIRQKEDRRKRQNIVEEKKILNKKRVHN